MYLEIEERIKLTEVLKIVEIFPKMIKFTGKVNLPALILRDDDDYHFPAPSHNVFLQLDVIV